MKKNAENIGGKIMQMMSDKAWKICQRNSGVWGEHPEYPKSDWAYEVNNNTTIRGYWDWVVTQIEQEENDE